MSDPVCNRKGRVLNKLTSKVIEHTTKHAKDTKKHVKGIHNIIVSNNRFSSGVLKSVIAKFLSVLYQQVNTF